MKQLMLIPLLVLLAGTWFSLEFVGCNVAAIKTHSRSVCNQTRFGNTCLKTFFTRHDLPLRKSFEDASEFCRAEVPGSTLVVIKNEEDQRMVESFINSQALGNETIITDARKPSENDSWAWLWVNGEETIPEDVRFVGDKIRVSSGVVLIYFENTNPAYSAHDVSFLSRYICEYSSSSKHSQSNFSYWQNNKSYVASASDATWYDARKECLRLGGDLASITDRKMIDDWSWLTKNHKYWIGCHRNKWIWNSTGAAITYSNWEMGYPTESSDRQCICLRPQCKSKDKREKNLCRYWDACNCNNSYAVICQTAKVNTATKSTTPTMISTKMNIKTRGRTAQTASTSSMNHESPSYDQTTAFLSSPSAELHECESVGTTKLCVILFVILFMAIVIVSVAIILFIRRYKNDGPRERSPLKQTDQRETAFAQYETMIRDKGSSDDNGPTYTELELTHQPSPLNSAYYANANQPASL